MEERGPFLLPVLDEDEGQDHVGGWCGGMVVVAEASLYGQPRVMMGSAGMRRANLRRRFLSPALQYAVANVVAVTVAGLLHAHIPCAPHHIRLFHLLVCSETAV